VAVPPADQQCWQQQAGVLEDQDQRHVLRDRQEIGVGTRFHHREGILHLNARHDDQQIRDELPSHEHAKHLEDGGQATRPRGGPLARACCERDTRHCFPPTYARPSGTVGMSSPYCKCFSPSP
jgi:hypothetical protein